MYAVLQEPYQCLIAQGGSPATNGSGSAAAVRGGQASVSSCPVVELSLQALQVQSKVQDVCVSLRLCSSATEDCQHGNQAEEGRLETSQKGPLPSVTVCNKILVRLRLPSRQAQQACTSTLR